MSLTSNFDKFHKSQDTGKEDLSKTEDQGQIEQYASAGHVRNLCFVQLDGKRSFLNYAYMISGSFSPEDNIITLSYTTHTVTLKGHHLDGLFEDIMVQLPKSIACMDSRYEALLSGSRTFVTNILVSEKQM